MDPELRNFLYRNPQYYEVVYPEPNEETPWMCRRLFSRYLPAAPASILDLGCGTGRDLAALSRDGAECWGVDYLAEMVAYARAARPSLDLWQGDMRSVRLGRTFDAILCLGSAFMYALSNQDVSATLGTFAAHAHAGTLLILDLNNAAGYLGGGSFRETIETVIDAGDFRARAVARNDFDRRRQWLVRRRTWVIAGQPPVEDFCRYRLFLPAELEYVLAEKGFSVAGMFDNKELRETDLSGPRLYVAAVYERPSPSVDQVSSLPSLPESPAGLCLP